VITSLGIALREGIEAALIVGIVLLYLAKTGREGLKRFVYSGVAAAFAVSVAVAVVLDRVGLGADDPYVEGTLLAVAGVFVITMVLWMRRASRGLKAGMEGKLEAVTSAGSGRLLGLGLFSFVFFMVLREGAELVLFLKAATLGATASAADLVGALVGLGLAVLFAVFFAKGSVRVDIGRFLRWTGWALVVLGAKLLLGSLHEFGEVGALPFANGFFEEAGGLTQGFVGDIIMGVVIAVPVGLLLWDMAAPVRRRVARRLGKGGGAGDTPGRGSGCGDIGRPAVEGGHGQH
jgi:high-affinity iron transporter